MSSANETIYIETGEGENEPCWCLECGWDGVENDLSFTTDGIFVCPHCGGEEVDDFYSEDVDSCVFCGSDKVVGVIDIVSLNEIHETTPLDKEQVYGYCARCADVKMAEGSTGDQIISWEDGAGVSSPSMPPSDIKWAESEAGGFRDGTGCISAGSFPGLKCEYCGFDPHDLVYYQCKQNDEDLTWDEWKDELEFYFYEGSHADNCKPIMEELEQQERRKLQYRNWVTNKDLEYAKEAESKKERIASGRAMHYAIPSEKKYPIWDKAHGRMALAWSQGTKYADRVEKAVTKRFPTMNAETVYRNYPGRKGPALSATSVKRGTRKRGNDGKMWEVRKSGRSQRWFRGAESFGAEDDMIICEGCNKERYSNVDFTIDNAREDVLDDGNVLCDYCWAAHDKYVKDAESDAPYDQGYDDQQDESLGERNVTTGEQSLKDRRDEASTMDKDHSMMGRKYDDVSTMDAEKQDMMCCGESMEFYEAVDGNPAYFYCPVCEVSIITKEFDAEEVPVVPDPSSFPQGDGRVLGQQTNQANLSPLHAEGEDVQKVKIQDPVMTGAKMALGVVALNATAIAGAALIGLAISYTARREV